VQFEPNFWIIPSSEPHFQNRFEIVALPTDHDYYPYWDQLWDHLPMGPPLQADSIQKIAKLSHEVKLQAALMTGGRDLHEIYAT
jgi:hypothetical protein